MAGEKPLTECGVSPFRWWIIRKQFFPIVMASLPGADWPHWEARYENDVEHKKRTTRDVGVMPASISDAIFRLRSAAVVSKWQEAVGYRIEDDSTMHGGGLHCSLGGSWLQVHLDYCRHPRIPGKRRALNLIAFLNPEWKPEWGGALLLCDPDGKAVKKIYPEPGMLAAFETSSDSYHGVEETHSAAPPRITAAVYYLADDRENETRSRAMFFPNRNPGGVPHEVKLCR